LLGFTLNEKGYVYDGIYQSTVYNDLWEYAPLTDTWEQRADFPGTARNNASVFTLNGKAYLATGGIDLQSPLQDIWEYDPLTDAWTQKADLPGAPRFSACSFSVGGKGFLTGGTTSYNPLEISDELWEYDPLLDQWMAGPTYPGTGMRNGFGFALNDIGYVGTGTPGSNEIWSYDPLTDTWIPGVVIPAPTISDARVAVVGDAAFAIAGTTDQQRPQNKVWKFDPVPATWTYVANLGGQPLKAGTGFVVNDRIFAGGGAMGFTFMLAHMSHALHEYDPVLDKWEDRQFHQAMARMSGVSFVIGDHAHVTTGATANNGEGAVLTSHWAYDVMTDSWAQKANFPNARSRAAGYSVGNKGYVSSGIYSSIWDAPILYNDVWEYDPMQDTWLPKAPLPAPGRYGCAYFTLNDKAYLAAGILADNTLSNELWEYDPFSDSWNERASIPGALIGGTGKGFSVNGKGYVGTSNALWEYDPIMDLWSPKQPPPIPIHSNSFTLGSGGKGYFGGGSLSAINAHALNDFYAYSPADDDFNVATAHHSMETLGIWPNPTAGNSVQIRWPGLDEASFTVEVTDIAGRVIRALARRMSSEMIQLDLLDAQPGIYSVRLRSNAAFATGRLILEGR
jgi:N-acetylneuraminic acid mutarotase